MNKIQDKCVLYQPADCCDECVVKPKDIVNNILETSDQSESKDQLIPVKGSNFQLLHSEQQHGLALVYIHKPPNISDSFLKFSNKYSAKDSGLKHNAALRDFNPVYSKKNCSSSGQNETCRRDSFTTESNFGVRKRLTEQQNSTIWCACSSIKRRRTLNTNSIQDVNTQHGSILKPLQDKYIIGDCQRGKWILKEGTNGCSSIVVWWREICSLISNQDLFHCNAAFQTELKEIWIYCDFIYCLQVYSTLKEHLKDFCVMRYHIHPHGEILSM